MAGNKRAGEGGIGNDRGSASSALVGAPVDLAPPRRMAERLRRCVRCKKVKGVSDFSLIRARICDDCRASREVSGRCESCNGLHSDCGDA